MIKKPLNFSPVEGLRELVLSVVIVAAADVTATACATTTATYVSLRPPMVCVPLRPGSRTALMISATGRFSLSVLAADQEKLAQRAGHPATGPDKMAEIGANPEWSPSATEDPPGVGGSAAVLWCAVREVVTAGDHLVFFGEVTACRGTPAGTGPGAALLLRHHRRYLRTGDVSTEQAAEGYPI